jgi:hypothetical protein
MMILIGTDSAWAQSQETKNLLKDEMQKYAVQFNANFHNWIDCALKWKRIDDDDIKEVKQRLPTYRDRESAIIMVKKMADAAYSRCNDIEGKQFNSLVSSLPTDDVSWKAQLMVRARKNTYDLSRIVAYALLRVAGWSKAEIGDKLVGEGHQPP